MQVISSLFFEATNSSTALNQTLIYLEMFETTKNKTHTSFSEMISEAYSLKFQLVSNQRLIELSQVRALALFGEPYGEVSKLAEGVRLTIVLLF
ncbi:hypothetical protein SAMN05428987_5594 [Paenibacillus sp. CF095]|nr:hypothetical protein SAMN05428987_5594 [Paenibacillus sp. CF095]